MKASLRLTHSSMIQAVKLWLAVIFVAVIAVQAQGQKADPNDPQNAERGAQLIRAAIEARGGSRYLAFKTLAATGQYTSFDKGLSTIPMHFSDTIVYLALDGHTHLPMSVSYEETGEKGVSKNEVRFFQYVVYDGVKFPNVVDFYRDGVQASRVNYESIKLDAPIPETLFTKPASVK